jgi:acetyltransferase-like isoleucine patch superfamily enzyme
MRYILNLLISVLPWSLKRKVLIKFYGYEIGSNCYIGYSYVFPDKLTMKDGSRIGHLNMIKNLQHLKLGEYSVISKQNWVSANISEKSYHHKARNRSLTLGKHTAITMNHRFDCTDSIDIGSFTTIAGCNSLFLTHSIDLEVCRQDCFPIKVGDYCFLGTSLVVLGGTEVCDYSVIGAKALLNKCYQTKFALYGGVPAKLIKPMDTKLAYFDRSEGYVE